MYRVHYHVDVSKWERLGKHRARNDQAEARAALSPLLSERYDARSRTFVAAPAMTERRFKLGNAVVTLPDGNVLVAGGSTRVELYDASAGRFRQIDPAMQSARNLGAAVLLDDGSVLIAGGYASVDPLPTTATALRFR